MIIAHITQLKAYTDKHISIMIQPEDTHYSWKAGQWVDFAIRHREQLHVAGYSFCSPSGSGRFELLVRHSQHPVTQWLMNGAQIGDEVYLGTASGSCCYSPQNHSPAVCLAGGVGITPMVSITRTARQNHKPVTLYHAIKNQGERLFAEEVDHCFVSAQDQRMDFTRIGQQHGPDAHYFLCGPRAFIDTACIKLQTLGCHNLHFERWW